MKAVNVRELKNNPSESLRMAKEGPVVVLNRDTPEAQLISLPDASLSSTENRRVVLATALFRDPALPHARAARVAGMPLEAFMAHAFAQGIPVLVGDSEAVDRDVGTLSGWLTKNPSPRTRVRQLSLPELGSCDSCAI